MQDTATLAIKKSVLSDKKVLESLVKVGAFDQFGERNQMLLSIDNILGYSQNIRKAKESNQMDIFGNSINAIEVEKIILNNTAPASEKEKLDLLFHVCSKFHSVSIQVKCLLIAGFRSLSTHQQVYSITYEKF
jgi:DNA polymerase-3 subunit alpha